MNDGLVRFEWDALSLTSIQFAQRIDDGIHIMIHTYPDLYPHESAPLLGCWIRSE